MHPEIDNPEYTPDSTLYSYEDFGALGLDLWQVSRHSLMALWLLSLKQSEINKLIFSQVKSGTIFDNFLITDDEKFAEEQAANTWGVTKVCMKCTGDPEWHVVALITAGTGAYNNGL